MNIYGYFECIIYGIEPIITGLKTRRILKVFVTWEPKQLSNAFNYFCLLIYLPGSQEDRKFNYETNKNYKK